MRRMRVGIVLFEDVEVLDFCGPFEVFSATRLNEDRRREEPSPFEVILAAEHAGPVTATGGMIVTPHRTFANCPVLDILLVPGGWGTRLQADNPVLRNWLRERAPQAAILASVCTGSMLLGAAGLLEGRSATTHWRSLDRMREAFPHTRVDRHRHFVQDGDLWTSAGISAGIDMSLRIVAHLHDQRVARATARHMEYPYPETDSRRIVLESANPVRSPAS